MPEVLAEQAPTVLVGRRCLLRPLQPDDAPALLHLYQDERVRCYLHDIPFNTGFWCDSPAVMRAQGAAWAVRHHGETIGCSMALPNTGVFRCNAEMSYWIKPSHWGLGIATEMLMLMTAWVWSARPALTRLYLSIFAANAASRRVASHCGYVLEGVLPKSLVKSGRPVDCALYGSYRDSHGLADRGHTPEAPPSLARTPATSLCDEQPATRTPKLVSSSRP
jgi:RimJ/RimL family protein N-acetyltransferase